MKFSTVFGFATLFAGAFALPAAQEEASLAAKRSLVSTLTGDVNSAVTLAKTITTEVKSAVTAGDVTAIIPELTTQLTTLNSTITTVLTDLKGLGLTNGKLTLSSILKLGFGTIGTVIQVLGQLISTVTTLVNLILTTSGLQSQLTSITGSGSSTALSTALQSVINSLPSVSSVISIL